MKTTVILTVSDGSIRHILHGQRMFLSNEDRSSRLLILFFGIICILLLMTIILIILYKTERSTLKCDQAETNIRIKHDEICLTPFCIKTANYLLESLNQTADPCEDFYEFTCGNWIKNTQIPSNANEENILAQMETNTNDITANLLSSSEFNESKAIRNARRLYTTCLNEPKIEHESINVLLSLINKEFGGWPVLQGLDWNESLFDLSRLWIQLSRYNSYVFFQFESRIDKKNPSNYRLKLSASPTSFGYKAFYTTSLSLARIYQQFMRDIITLLANDRSMIDRDIQEIFNLEKQIIQIHLSPKDQNDVKYLRTTVKSLTKTLNTSFDFTHNLQSLYVHENLPLSNQESIVISDIDTIRNISLLINIQSARTLQNYMIWRFLIYQIPNMPKRFRNIFNRLQKSVLGVSHQQSRAIVCASHVTKYMDFAVAKLYLNKFYDKSSHDQSNEIVDHIRNTFVDMIDQSSWMNSLSKNRTIEKVKAIIQHVGHPEYLDGDDLTHLEDMYIDYDFNSSHIGNILYLMKLNTKSNLQKIYKTIAPDEWIDYGPLALNAFYHPLYNKIVVPAGILQPPYFHKDAPKYLNYGAIGSIVGHEITHGFDELRRHYDKHQNKYTSWSQETANIFEQRSQCLIEQYNNYFVREIGLRVNGQQTREENIADNDGLKKAFYAYQKWIKHQNVDEKKLPGLEKFTSEQMFFISFGHMWCSKMTDGNAKAGILTDPHAPSQFRVNGPTSNFDEFDRVFQCRPGQGNSRVNKCSVW